MDTLKRAYTRIDARSLGLFRILFGIALIGDLFARWGHVRDFYSNDGVLPNHNHLFILKDEAEVWSVYHSFSSVGEAHAAFVITLFLYACFTVGWYTRTFQAASLVCLIGLSGRNVLTHGPGDSVAVALLAISWFLPLGLRLSVDALRRSWRERDEKTPAELNERPPLPSPRPSLAPLLTWVLLGVIYTGGALAQTGETWRSGEALHYALHVDRWTSALGVALRDVAGLSAGLTPLLHFAPLAIVPLALVPVGRRWTRGLALTLAIVHGLVLGALFTFGLYAWSLLAAATLLIPEETWAARYGPNRRRPRPLDVFYDADCGVCLASARLARRLDWAGDITFAAATPEALVTHPGFEGDEEEASRLVETTMVAFAGDRMFLYEQAVAQVGGRAALVGPLFALLRLPGVRRLARSLYRRFATRRREVSVALGMGACGLPAPKAADEGRRAPTSEAAPREAPADRWGRRFGALLTTAGAAGVVAVALAANETHDPDTPLQTGLSRIPTLVSLGSYARILGDWGLFAPDPPRHNAALVVDATTQGAWNVDPITGWPPDLDLSQPARARKGTMWLRYQEGIGDEARVPFRKEFRRYLTRGGRVLDRKDRNQALKSLEVYWVKRDIPAPGADATGEVERVKIFSQRGALSGGRSPARRRAPR
ncbi:MAG: DCC1-like thiol-disulfide oxidoreductase family protein [Myxococcota bacterium]